MSSVLGVRGLQEKLPASRSRRAIASFREVADSSLVIVSVRCGGAVGSMAKQILIPCGNRQRLSSHVLYFLY